MSNPSGKPNRRLTESGLLFFLLAVFVFFGLLSIQISPRARWVPLGACLPGAALCLWILVRGSEPKKQQRRAAAAQKSASGARNLALTLSVSLAAAAVGGLIYAVPLCYLLFALLSDGRAKLWQALAAALAATLFIYILFGVLLRVPLQRGVL
ncbi:MAG: tripartite tricarboxylate transporter TctB family protein [Acidobacteriota bacterium]